MRSREREQFLADVLVTAVEGGTGYWAQVSNYYWSDEDPATTRVTLHDMDEGDTFDLTIESIAGAFGKLDKLVMQTCKTYGDEVLHNPAGFRAYVSPQRRARLLAASRANDAIDLDADDADVIAQLACFGRVIYG